jgi:hypothetical protein
MISMDRRSMVLLAVASMSLAGKGATAAAGKATAAAYHDLWRKLWEDHITWTRVVIMAILDNLAGTNVYIERLLKNYEDMEATLAADYGDEAEVLGELIEEHLVIAAELLTAARNNDTAAFEDARARWYANADQNATQMSRMNPRFWPLAETRQMWFDHLDATLEEATTHMAGNFSAEVAAYDRVHDLALEMADFFSNGVIRQFPQKFLGKA